jgi:hypothetical protein
MAKNQHDLDRYVPAGIAREIRQRCGFGCVRCGLAFYDIEHFDPDFSDATSHNPDGMTLLCMQCNQKRARGTLSREAVAAANAAPKCREQGFASEVFDLLSTTPVEVVFAGSTIIGCPVLISINGEPILSLKAPEVPRQPYLLSGIFTDKDGCPTLSIENNVYSVSDANWDVTQEGALTTIRSGRGKIVLQLRVTPPSKIIVERIEMHYAGVMISGDQDVLKVSHDGGAHWTELRNCVAGYSSVAFAF